MSESIERMRKLVDDNLVMGLRFQMNRELNELEREIEQELNSRVKPPCDGGYCPLCGANEAWNTRADYHGYEQAAIEAWESVKAWNSRAERTCHIEWRDDSHDTDAGYERDGAYFCTACGADLPYPLQECWDDYQAGNYEKPFNYCPNCGARRVGE